MNIPEIQNKLREMAGVAPLKVEAPRIISVDYKKMSTADLQHKFDTVELWMKSHKDHPDFLRGSVEMKRMNKELASRISI